MLKQLKYKNEVIPGYFIDQNGKIYDSEGVEQEQKLYTCDPYFYFKNHKVHIMLAHSFYGYKEGFDIHHLNQIKTDNRLQNLVYLTREQHISLHKTGMKHSEQSKTKMSVAKKGKKISAEHKAKIIAALMGKKFSAEHKAKILSFNSKKRKKVFCPELNKIFEGVKIAGRELSLSAGCISQCCQGKRKTCGGFHFEFYTEEQD